jgi:uncharacterized membrane protein HdeD (DUF308 family)
MKKTPNWPKIFDQILTLIYGILMIGAAFLPKLQIWTIILFTFCGSAFIFLGISKIIYYKENERIITISSAEFRWLLEQIKKNNPEWLL